MRPPALPDAAQSAPALPASSPGAPTRRARRQMRRRSGILAGVSSAVILVVALAAVAVWPDTEPRRSARPLTATTTVPPGPWPDRWQSLVSEDAIRQRAGVANPDRLKLIDGDLTITDENATVADVDVQGTIFIKASGVTVRNFRARNVAIGERIRKITLERGLLDGLGDGRNTTDGVSFNDFTARGLEITRQLDGFKAHGNVLIEDCWVHDLNGLRGRDTGAGGYTHNDAVQTSSGSNVVIRNNRFERPGLNSAVFIDPDQGPINNVRIENNYLNGGTFTLYVIKSRSAPQYGMPTNVVVNENVFGTTSQYGPAALGPGVVFTGNIMENGDDVVVKADDASS